MTLCLLVSIIFDPDLTVVLSFVLSPLLLSIYVLRYPLSVSILVSFHLSAITNKRAALM